MSLDAQETRRAIIDILERAAKLAEHLVQLIDEDADYLTGAVGDALLAARHLELKGDDHVAG